MPQELKSNCILSLLHFLPTNISLHNRKKTIILINNNNNNDHGNNDNGNVDKKEKEKNLFKIIPLFCSAQLLCA